MLGYIMGTMLHELSTKDWLKGLIDLITVEDLVIAYAARRCGLTKAHACSLIIAAREKRAYILSNGIEKQATEDDLIMEAWEDCYAEEKREYDYNKYKELIDKACEFRELADIPNPIYYSESRPDGL